MILKDTNLPRMQMKFMNLKWVNYRNLERSLWFYTLKWNASSSSVSKQSPQLPHPNGFTVDYWP